MLSTDYLSFKKISLAMNDIESRCDANIHSLCILNYCNTYDLKLDWHTMAEIIKSIRMEQEQ